MLDWQVLEKIEPWGQLREDWRFAVMCSVIAKGLGVTKADKTAFTADDFLLDKVLKQTEDEPEKPTQTADQIEAMFRMSVAANNAFWAKQGKH